MKEVNASNSAAVKEIKEVKNVVIEIREVTDTITSTAMSFLQM